MYLKITKQNEIIDCIENPQFVEWNNISQMYLISDNKDGIISRDGSMIYQIREVKDNPAEVYTAVETTKEEYDSFISSLPKPEEKYTLDEAAQVIAQEVSRS